MKLNRKYILYFFYWEKVAKITFSFIYICIKTCSTYKEAAIFCYHLAAVAQKTDFLRVLWFLHAGPLKRLTSFESSPSTCVFWASLLIENPTVSKKKTKNTLIFNPRLSQVNTNMAIHQEHKYCSHYQSNVRGSDNFKILPLITFKTTVHTARPYSLAAKHL